MNHPPSIDNRPVSLAHFFLSRVRTTPDAEAYRFPVPAAPGAEEEWHSLTWAHTGARAAAIAAGLMSLGIRPQERVGIVSGTRVEWILADLGVMCAGAATTTVYPTTDADETAYILADSGSRVLFAEDAGQLAKVVRHRAELPELTAVVTFEPVDAASAGGTDDADGPEVLSLAELERRGTERLRERPDAVEETVAKIDREDLATLIYTSGTTGRPKGVRLAHDCWSFQAQSALGLGLLSREDLEFAWLPMAHAFGKNLLCAQIAVGYPLAVDGRLERLPANLRLLRPTVMAAVPRVFEKIYNSLATEARRMGGTKQRIFDWAARVARDYTRAAQAKGAECGQGMESGKTLVPFWLSVQHVIADRLVYAGVREVFGGRIRGCTSGSAPLAPDIGLFFCGAGIPILEGYGLTESSCGASMSLLEYRTGVAGRPLPGVEVRVADSGEILMRGPNIMRGYHHLPEKTAEVLDSDGWFHTGDLGELTEDGYLRITGRIKELIKTSGGKYVAPLEIESRLKGACPFISNVVVVGDHRHYCTALITLDEPTLTAWARERGLTDPTYAGLCGSPEVRALVAGYVDGVNAGLQRWQTIKRFTVLPRDFDQARGEVTPSMKVRRPQVQRSFAAEIDAMYEETHHS
ncbi:long-chain fatty acid--CoA ligase [Streptomyces sp. NA02950]|uniref:AMP-dependent synthetase/ligase n=1 Tax=Streptomyces sp. NA02950 TaxID=2742137 RepID=UPI0015928535|nr:long-chain fatty acid--CoA ligase [Streptomyces sp. NA02950]QKV96601.1 long-chain fatty acid--CoA ligase [Streptomyces sp. NA02950]